MKYILNLVLIIISMSIGLSQPSSPKEYAQFVKKADSLYKKKQYLQSGNTYSLAFRSFGWKGYLNDRYNAARAWAQANVIDSAFFQLERIAYKGNYANYKEISRDQDLILLQNDSRWQNLLVKVKANKDDLEANFNKGLLNLLDSLVTEDQKWRKLITQYNNKELLHDTISFEYISRKIAEIDSLNYVHLMNIFNQYGFPNSDLVGTEGSFNFWLLVQHQDAHAEFQEKVLSKMKVEAEKGKASFQNYAYLVDRVKVNTNQLQVYGTQMILNSKKDSYEPKPLVDPEKVNERRKEVGLGTIEDYIKSMNSRYIGTLKSN